jgi:hypothetical protein
MKRSSTWALAGLSPNSCARGVERVETRRLQLKLRFFSDAFRKEISSLAQKHLS